MTIINGEYVADWEFQCRRCGAEITSAELCHDCADGNDPFSPEIQKHRPDLVDRGITREPSK